MNSWYLMKQKMGKVDTGSLSVLSDTFFFISSKIDNNKMCKSKNIFFKKTPGY